jgi:hypothetical protein
MWLPITQGQPSGLQELGIPGDCFPASGLKSYRPQDLIEAKRSTAER